MVESRSKIPLTISFGEYLLPLAYLLSLTLLALEFPLAYLMLLGVLIYSFFKNRYDILIQCTLLFGVFSFYDENVSFPFKWADISLFICFVGIVIYRRSHILNKILLAFFIYVLFLFFIAYISDESMLIQIRRLRQYLHIVYFMFPLLVFGNRMFCMETFFKHLFIYVLIISVFYVLDSLVLCEHIFLPRNVWGDLTYTTLRISPFSYFVRIYPACLFIIALLVYPIIYSYRVSWIHWVIMALAIVCTKTFSIIFGLFFTWFLYYGNLKQKMRYLIIAMCIFALGSVVDSYSDGLLRINQLKDQFTALFALKSIDNAMDNMEELAEFASGRGAQIIPKLELLTSSQKQLFGFGFLHDKLTSNDDFIIYNPYYSDQSAAEEVATLVEVTQVQTVLDAGFVGVIVQHLFYVILYLFIRKYKYAPFYLMTLICISVFGVGGFSGLNQPHGLLLLGLSLGCILLANKKNEIINHNACI